MDEIKVRHRDKDRKRDHFRKDRAKERKARGTMFTMRFFFQRSQGSPPGLQISTSRYQRTPCLDLDNALPLSAALPGTIS